jgi:H+-transporting ATPase
MSSEESSNGKGHEKDIEKGNPVAERARDSYESVDYGELDEYTALQKYITSYRDPRAAAIDDAAGQQKDAADAKKGQHWWIFWRRGTSRQAKDSDPGVVPDDWLNTDIHNGIKSSEVETRRKRFGWNEITTERENMFKKFLSYFTGPILYGQFLRLPTHPPLEILIVYWALQDHDQHTLQNIRA